MANKNSKIILILNMPPAKTGSKLSADVQKKIEAIRKQKKVLPKGMEPVPKEQMAISDQIAILASAGLKSVPMDIIRIYQGEKVIEISKAQFMGNPRDNIWSVSGTEIEKAVTEVPDTDMYVNMFRKYMTSVSKSMGNREEAVDDADSGEPKVEDAAEEQAADGDAPAPDAEPEKEEEAKE